MTEIVRKSVGLKKVQPFAQEAIQATGIDPWKAHKAEHAQFARDWGGQVKELRLLTRPSEEDQLLRKELREAGFTPFGDELVTDTGIVHVITDLPRES